MLRFGLRIQANLSFNLLAEVTDNKEANLCNHSEP